MSTARQLLIFDGTLPPNTTKELIVPVDWLTGDHSISIEWESGYPRWGKAIISRMKDQYYLKVLIDTDDQSGHSYEDSLLVIQRGQARKYTIKFKIQRTKKQIVLGILTAIFSALTFTASGFRSVLRLAWQNVLEPLIFDKLVWLWQILIYLLFGVISLGLLAGCLLAIVLPLAFWNQRDYKDFGVYIQSVFRPDIPTPTYTPGAVLTQTTPTVVAAKPTTTKVPPTKTNTSPPSTTIKVVGPVCTYIVQPGEWIMGIARKYNVAIDEFLAANPRLAKNPNTVLNPGEVVNIPNCKPTSTPSYTPSPNCSSVLTHLKVGQLAEYVNVNWKNVNLYRDLVKYEPITAYTINVGDVFRVIDGPICVSSADKVRWAWKFQAYDPVNSLVGWQTENDWLDITNFTSYNPNKITSTPTSTLTPLPSTSTPTYTSPPPTATEIPPTATSTNTPTGTYTPIPLTATPEKSVCINSPLSSRVKVGDIVKVVNSSTYGLFDDWHNSNVTVGTLRSGDVYTIVDGPYCKDGYTHWKIANANLSGWTVEYDYRGAYLLEPYDSSKVTNTPPPPTLTPTPSPTWTKVPPTQTPVATLFYTSCMPDQPVKVKLYDLIRIQVTGNPLYVDPGSGATVPNSDLSSQYYYQVIAGPVCGKNGYRYWKLAVWGRFDSVMGWTTETNSYGTYAFVPVVNIDWSNIPTKPVRIHINQLVKVVKSKGDLGYYGLYEDSQFTKSLGIPFVLGDYYRVLAGPLTDSSGYVYWKLQRYSVPSQIGWTTETDSVQDYVLEPTDYTVPPPGAPIAPTPYGVDAVWCEKSLVSQIGIGMLAVVTQASDGSGTSYNVRLEAGSTQPILGSLDSGDIVEVKDKPICADGLTWWYIKVNTSVHHFNLVGQSGYMAESLGDDYHLYPYHPPATPVRVTGYH